MIATVNLGVNVLNIAAHSAARSTRSRGRHSIHGSCQHSPSKAGVRFPHRPTSGSSEIWLFRTPMMAAAVSTFRVAGSHLWLGSSHWPYSCFGSRYCRKWSFGAESASSVSFYVVCIPPPPVTLTMISTRLTDPVHTAASHCDLVRVTDSLPGASCVEAGFRSLGYGQYKGDRAFSCNRRSRPAGAISICRASTGYGLGDERIVEYPWALVRIPPGRATLLDAGSTSITSGFAQLPVISNKLVVVQTLAPEGTLERSNYSTYTEISTDDLPR